MCACVTHPLHSISCETTSAGADSAEARHLLRKAATARQAECMGSANGMRPEINDFASQMLYNFDTFLRRKAIRSSFQSG
jgi:hypothetical protein